MAQVNLSREQFLSWLGNDPTFEKALAVSAAKDRKSTDADAIIVSDEWPANNAADALSLVLASTKVQDDFFAFVSTYVSTYVPFSAFFRVITVADLELKHRSVASIPLDLLNPVTGAVMCGSVGAPENRGRGKNALSECLTSKHFCFGKALLSADAHQFEKIAVRWEACQKALSPAHNPRALDRESSFWQTLFSMQNGDSYEGGGVSKSGQLSEAVKALLQSRSLDSNVWNKVGEICPPVLELRREMELSRELRARAFTRFIRGGGLERFGAEADFLVGFLGATLGGARVEYSGLIDGLTNFYPAAALWFGFVCGCVEGNDVLTADASLGRHVQRQLSPTGDDGRRDVDISFGELRVIGPEKGGLDMLRPRVGDAILVEVAPDLIVPIRRGAGRGESARSSPEYSGDAARIKDAFVLAQKLVNLLSSNETRPGTDLFSEKPSPRKRSKRS